MTQQTNIDLGQLLREAVESRLADVCVSLPAKVLAYDASKQTAKLQLLIKRKRRDAAGVVTANEIAALQEVPVAFMRCNGAWITFPLAVGDVGMVVFAHRSIKDWMGKSAGEIVEPTDEDKLSVNGAWFYPGGYPGASPIEGGADATNPVIHTATFLDLGEKSLTPADLVAIGQLVDNGFTKVQIAHDTHQHPSGMGPTGVPTVLISSVPSTKALKVRAK